MEGRKALESWDIYKYWRGGTSISTGEVGHHLRGGKVGKQRKRKVGRRRERQTDRETELTSKDRVGPVGMGGGGGSIGQEGGTRWNVVRESGKGGARIGWVSDGRDEVLLDQQRDVVIVFWTCCILPI
jgi:hypothetical protein